MTGATGLEPVGRAARIDALDVLRGIAILGIFYMNVPYMASNVVLLDNDIRSLGWTPFDQSAWVVVQLLLEGTQRGLLELLFGAGMMVLAARAMTPDGPVATADLYYRRNLWLLAFGLFDIFVLLWPGDILHIYALAALFLFPFRTLAPKWLLAIGLSFALLTAALGAVDYVERSDLAARAQSIEAQQKSGIAPDAEAKAVLTEWREVVDARKIDADEKKKLETEVAARSPGASLTSYGWFLWQEWIGFAGWRWTVGTVVEAFCMMLIGVALWKWGVIQGSRSTRFYAGLAAAGYAVGLAIRGVGAAETLAFSTTPKTIWATWEFGRIAVTLGHVGLIHLLLQSVMGTRLLHPFKAAGRTAFSLYFMQQIIGNFVLFAPFGLGWFGRFGWAELALIATIVIVAQLVIANIWVRYFVSGPLEWLWRSLSYQKRQPFRRLAAPLPAQTGQTVACDATLG